MIITIYGRITLDSTPLGADSLMWGADRKHVPVHLFYLMIIYATVQHYRSRTTKRNSGKSYQAFAIFCREKLSGPLAVFLPGGGLSLHDRSSVH